SSRLPASLTTMKRRSASGSVVGRANFAARASSTMVAGRSALSRWVCSSALGRRASSSRVSIGVLRRPARAYHHSEDGAGLEQAVERQLDATAIGDQGGAGSGAGLERRIV